MRIQFKHEGISGVLYLYIFFILLCVFLVCIRAQMNEDVRKCKYVTECMWSIRYVIDCIMIRQPFNPSQWHYLYLWHNLTSFKTIRSNATNTSLSIIAKKMEIITRFSQYQKSTHNRNPFLFFMLWSYLIKARARIYSFSQSYF